MGCECSLSIWETASESSLFLQDFSLKHMHFLILKRDIWGNVSWLHWARSHLPGTKRVLNPREHGGLEWQLDCLHKNLRSISYLLLCWSGKTQKVISQCKKCCAFWWHTNCFPSVFSGLTMIIWKFIQFLEIFSVCSHSGFLTC